MFDKEIVLLILPDRSVHVVPGHTVLPTIYYAEYNINLTQVNQVDKSNKS